MIVQDLERRGVARGDCLVWTGAINNMGYGRVRVKQREWLVHRLAHTLRHGPLAAGELVLHGCDNPPCFKDEHLFVGSHLDNSRDMVNKGRRRNGNEAKTHCPHGHPYDEANTYRDRDGGRQCRECSRRRVRARRARERIKQ